MLSINVYATPFKTEIVAAALALIISSAGRYAAVSASALCQRCSATTYSGARATICSACLVGQRLAVEASTSLNVGCLDCIAGKYSSTGTTTECVSCTAGRYQNSNASALCLDCTAGRFQDSSAGRECIFCSPGTYSAKSASLFCEKCSPGTYSVGTGSVGCEICPTFTYSSSPSFDGCRSCIGGYYKIGLKSENGTLFAECAKCENYTKKVSCSSTGVTVNNIDLNEGYWRLRVSSRVEDIRECPLGSQACKGGRLDVQKAQTGWQNVSGQCRKGYTGPLCAVRS